MDKRITFEDAINESISFGRDTFITATPISGVIKTQTELQEVESCLRFHPDDTEHLMEEYADVIMCIFDSANRAGISVFDLTKAIQRKTEVNKGRKWTMNPNGTYQHSLLDIDYSKDK